jgi:putative PIN family toxin of toxin-antitoxin system
VDLVRILIDSNVLISAIVFDANELKIMVHCLRKGHELVISEHIEEEVFRTMLDKFPEYSGLLHEFINLSAIEIVPREKYQQKIEDYDMVRDKHDRHILATANCASCDIIVTGDKDLLVLKSCDGLRILNARDAMKFI